MSTPLINTNDIAARLAVRKPGWTQQTVTLNAAETRSNAPTLTSEGVALGEAPTTLLAVVLRKVAHRRTVQIQLTSYDPDNFFLTINGHEMVYDGSGDATPEDFVPAFVSAITAELGASGSIAQLIDVTAQVVAGVGFIDITGLGSADYSLELVTDGTSTYNLIGDAASAVLVPSFTLDEADGFNAQNEWYIDPQQIARIDGYLGTQIRRLNTGGYLRGFMHLEQIALVPGDSLGMTLYPPRAYWGPAQSET
jgi:hypothetical protein